MILAISNDQTEVDNHHQIVQDHKGVHRHQIRITEVDQDLKHNRPCQIRTTEVNYLSPEDLIREVALISNGQVTKDKPQKGTTRIQEMVTGSKEMSEIGQINDRLRRNRTVVGRSGTDRTPCCQSNGCESGGIGRMLQKGTRRRAAFNGSNEGCMAERQSPR